MAKSRGGQGGAIVNISSVAARIGSPNEYVDYAGSKAAIDAMTVGLSKELGPEGIRVNAVRPGLIETEIHIAAGDPDRVARSGSAIPLGRAGSPDEVDRRWSGYLATMHRMSTERLSTSAVVAERQGLNCSRVLVKTVVSYLGGFSHVRRQKSKFASP
jgi:NAD(P)-dependent dehydrogenase (short-subunit alcohol dehydrogenase family)